MSLKLFMPYFMGASAIVPALMLVYYFTKRDLYPEPSRAVWTTFFLGVIATVAFALTPYDKFDMWFLSMLEHPFSKGAALAFMGAAIPEEFIKLLVLLGFSYRSRFFDEPMDGMVYGAAASLGFAALENITYVSHYGFACAVSRALTSVPGHAADGAIMGYFVGRAFSATPKKAGLLIFTGYAIAVVLHGLYDMPLMTAGFEEASGGISVWGGSFLVVWLITLIFSIYLTLYLLRKNRIEQLQTIPPPPMEAFLEAKSSKKIFGVVQLIVGVLLATLGAFLTAIFMDLSDELSVMKVGDYISMVMILGFLPLIGGVLLFIRGINRLNRLYPVPIIPKN